MSVLGTLTGTVIAQTDDITNTAQVSACRTEARITHTAVEAFRAVNGAHPTSDANLVPSWLLTAPTLVTLDYPPAGSPSFAWAGACGNADAGTP